MLIDDFPTRVTIWSALIAYAGSVVCWIHSNPAWARRLWTLGCLFYLVHVVVAFDLHYRWSHSVAVASTAERTEQLTGIRTEAGIYVNYFFTLVWVCDVAYWWLAGQHRYRQRPRSISWALHLFFVFMVFNGAIVFASGPARWIGIAVLTVIGADFLALRMGQLHPMTRSKSD